MEPVADRAAALPDAAEARSSASRSAPYLQRPALYGAGWLRVAAAAPGFWPVEDGLSLLPALEPAGLLAGYP